MMHPTTTNNNYILWIGSLLDISDIKTGLPASIAAIRWQTGLAAGIIDQNISIHCISKPSGLYWPKGPLRLGRESPKFFGGISGTEIRFLNLPKLRTFLMSRAYLKALSETVKRLDKPDIAVFYNITRQNYKTFCTLKYTMRVPCIILAADIPARSNPEYIDYKKACVSADGIIYLSKNEFDKSTISHKMHMDGGISLNILNQRLSNVPKPLPYLMYAGSFDAYCGIDLMLDALDRCDSNIRLVVCGKCNNPRLLTRLIDSPRVDYKGFVPDKELEDLSRYASGFINSYLPSSPVSDGKFPSKIFEYLSYGRPVISTLTSGIAHEYKDILYIVEGENPEHMAGLYNNVFYLSQTSYETQIQKNKEFLLSRTWEHQSKRFLNFVNNCTH